jgi:hypothetical protein
MSAAATAMPATATPAAACEGGRAGQCHHDCHQGRHPSRSVKSHDLCLALQKQTVRYSTPPTCLFYASEKPEGLLFFRANEVPMAY